MTVLCGDNLSSPQLEGMGFPMVCCHLGFEEFTLLKPGRLRKMQDSELK